MEGELGQNTIESSFMPLDHQRYVIGSCIILSDNIFHVIGLDWIGFHVIGSYVIQSDDVLYVTGSDFMLLDRNLYVNGSYIILSGATLKYGIQNPENKIRKTKENKFFKSGIL